MALYRHIASGVTPGEMFTFSLYTNGNVSLAAAQAAWTDSVSTFWTGTMAPNVANEVALSGTSTAEIDVATGKQSTRVEDALNLPGTSVAESLPFQCSPGVSLRTIFATRSGRGRFYLPPLAVSAMAGGRISGAVVTLLADGVSLMMTTLQSSGLTPVVYSRMARAAVTITNIDVGNVMDTQRRRRNKLIEVRETRPV